MDSSGSQEKKSIPRFASFKPKPAPPVEADDRESPHRDEKSKHRSRHRSHRDRSRSRERRRERERHRPSNKAVDQYSRKPTPEYLTESKPVVKKPENEAPDLFVVDLKGDKYNRIYGTIHRYSVPQYHRVGRGSVLGLPSNYKIDRETAEGDTLVLTTDTSRTNAKRTKAKSILSGLDKQRTRLLRIRQPSFLDATADLSRDYLPINVSGNRRGKGVIEGLDTDDERYAYRSIHGKAKPEDDIPSDVEAISDSNSDEEGLRVDPDEEIKRLNVELSRGVEQSPTDVGTWLRLIDHQDSLLRGHDRESRPLTNAERKSLADIKLSLYEKALKKVGHSPSKDRLLLGLLEEGAKLWDTRKLSSQWQAVLKANSHFISLWVKYLDFRQTEFLDFTYERCFGTFLECMRLNRSSPDSPEKSLVQVYLFLRLTLFMREAGFTEHAVGLWQAILELTFFRPEELSISNDQEKMLSAFIEFWESEVARIGEVGAGGWKSRDSNPIDPKVFTPQSRINPRSIFASWTACERERIHNARLPARSLDESDDDDPYRVIISSDLQEIISLIWDLNSAHVLIDGFLYFCQLPPIRSPENAESTSAWVGDNFLRNDLMSNVDFTLDDWFASQSASAEHSTSSPVTFSPHNFIHTLETFFADQETWFSSFRPWAKATLNLWSDIDPDLVRRALRLLVEANPRNDDLAEYTLAVEYASNSKEARRYAKSLLKKRSSNLRLYNSYALIECRSGNQAAADHVWATTLSMSKTFSAGDRVDCALLWHMWIWEKLDARNIAQASHLLQSIPQNSVDLKALPDATIETTFSPASLLKVHNFLSETQENVLASRKPNVFVACTDCLALLQYLSNSLDLHKSLAAYSNAITRLAQLPEQNTLFKTFTTELLHQARAKLLYYHVRTSSLYKPSHIRALLAESISLFPHNTIFLSLFAWNESRFRIEERVRDVIRDVTRTTRPNHLPTITQQIPITTHLFSIYTELSRPIFAGSTSHSVRAAFEKAIGDQQLPGDTTRTSSDSSSTARSSLSLWKLYVLFELSRNDVQRAKDVFYRGMRACPWSKELLMLAFSHLREDVIRDRYKGVSRKGEGMDFHELRRAYNVLVEKELRIHVDIENELDELEANMQLTTSALGVPIHMPEDAESGDERMLL